MKYLFAIVIGLACLGTIRAQIAVHIASLAENTPSDAVLYFAGNINGWNPGDPSFQLELRPDGDYWIDLPPGSGKIEFKFTRGSWASVESNGNGGFRPNRTYTYGNGDTLHLSILGWEDLDQGGGPNSTANDQVQIWAEKMYMPTLDRERRIWVYLPVDYEQSTKEYAVLYMHDGQNVFDAATSFAGEWQVDETLTRLEGEGYPGLIVVAIDNGGSHRLDEYSPFIHPDYGGGEGDAYLDFIVETLKPKIDSSFRTRSGPRFTGIMGSSMGGLISHYAHFRYPDVFGKAGIFSPSYWFSDQFFSFTENTGKTDSASLYLLAGALENSIASGAQNMFHLWQQMGYTDEEIQLSIVPDGQHSEWFWAREFEDAVTWLFPTDELAAENEGPESGIKVFPNPSQGEIRIEGQGEMDVRLFDHFGRLIHRCTLLDEGQVSVGTGFPGSGIIVCIHNQGRQLVKNVLLF